MTNRVTDFLVTFRRRVSSFEPWRVYGVMGLFFGLVLCFLTPPFMVADEIGHFFRAFQISEGEIVTHRIDETHAGTDLPRSLMAAHVSLVGSKPSDRNAKIDWTVWRAALTTPLDPNDRTPTVFPQGLYNPLVYVPAATGIAIARVFDASPVILLYVGRVLTCLAMVSLVTLAIWLSPIMQWTLAAIMLVPLVLFQSASVSADAMTFALCFFFIATAWRYMLQKDKSLDRRSGALLILASIGVALAKQAYFPLLTLLVFIPKRFYGDSSRRKWTVTLGLAGISIAFVAAWTWLIIPINVPSRFDIPVDSKAQLRHVLGDPMGFLGLVWKDVGEHAFYYLDSMVGKYLAWLDLILPSKLIMAIGRNVILIALCDGVARYFVSLKVKLVHAALVVTLFTFILLTQYLAWTRVGAAAIDGPSGRYFIPFLPAAFLLLYNRRIGTWLKAEKWLPMAIVIQGLYCGIELARHIIRRYYLA